MNRGEYEELRAEIKALQRSVDRLLDFADDMTNIKGEHNAQIRDIKEDIKTIFKKVDTMNNRLAEMGNHDTGVITKDVHDARSLSESAIRRIQALEDADKKNSDRVWQVMTIVLSAALAFAIAWYKGG
jgi:phage host-nuclease inhibitor protein Gam